MARARVGPAPGDLYALEVAPGRQVLFRVVAEERGHHCAILTRWEGPAPARLEQVRADRRIFAAQRHDHHAWNREVIGAWVQKPPPPELRYVGNVPVKEAEAARVVHPQVYVAAKVSEQRAMSSRVVPLGAWEIFQARLQWRWDHDREALLAEEAAEERARADTFANALAEQGRANEKLAKQGVKALAKKKFFSVWKGDRPKPLIAAAEALMQEAIGELDGLPPAKATKRLVRLVKDFNRLDGREHSFDTTDAEDIMDAVGTVAIACGVDDDTFDDVIDAARDF